MNKLFPLAFCVLLATACGSDKKTKPDESINYESEAKNPVEHGKELFEGVGNCFACHQPEQKIIAPSLQQIATIYKTQNGNMVEFLKGNGKPIVDPKQYEVMKTNFAITKTMSDQELKALEAYVLSFGK